MNTSRQNEGQEEKKKEITSSLEELLPLPKDIINIIVPYFHINDLITLYTSDNPRTKEFALTEIKEALQKLATTIKPDIHEIHSGKFHEAFQKLYQESDQALARELISFFKRLNISIYDFLRFFSKTLDNPTVVTEFLTGLDHHGRVGDIPKQLLFLIATLMAEFHQNPSTRAEVSENEKWVRTISLFLARGADPNLTLVWTGTKHYEAVTLLNRAIHLNSVELVKLFIRFESNLVEESFDRQFFRSPPYKFVLDKKKNTETLLTQAEILLKAYGGELHIYIKRHRIIKTFSNFKKMDIYGRERLVMKTTSEEINIENFNRCFQDPSLSSAEFVEQLVNYSDLKTAIRAWKIILEKCDSIIRVLEPLVRKKQEEEEVRKAEESKREEKEEKKTEAKEKEQDYGVQERNGIRIEIARKESMTQTADQMKLEEWRKREIEAEKDEDEEKLKELRRRELENRREIKSEKKEEKEKNEKSSPNLKQEIDYFLIFVQEYKKRVASISDSEKTESKHPTLFSSCRRKENLLPDLITAIQQLDHRDEECEKRLNALKKQFLDLYNHNPKGNEVSLTSDKVLTLPTLNIAIDTIVRRTVNDEITARWW